MRNTNILSYEKNKVSVKAQTAVAILAIAGAVVIPQAFHAAGAALGLGSGLGAAFLPMHIPVILAAFFAGPIAGAAAGLLGPLAAYLISGMPAMALLPFMMIELCGYGVLAGIAKDIKAPSVLKLIGVMIGGRAAKAAAILFAVYVMGVETIGVQSIWTSVKEGLPGIVLQLILIPVILNIVEKASYEN